HAVTSPVGYGEVGAAVAVEVSHRHGPASGGGGAGGLKGAVAVAQEHAHTARVDHDEVGAAVAVEIRHGMKIVSGVKSQRGEEPGYDTGLQLLQGRFPGPALAQGWAPRSRTRHLSLPFV